MLFGPRRILAIVLLLAAASPPPRVTNALIADAPQQGSGEARKPFQARGRNRIGAPITLDACRSLAPIASGEARPRRRSRFLAHRPAPAPKPAHLPSHSPSDHATPRLRC